MKPSIKAAAASLLSLSLCAAFSAQAADVKMYGIIDTGIIVENNKMGTGESSTWAREEFGVNLGPRIGLIATEKVNEDLTVRMQLENLFESDNGAMRFNRLWGGESSLAVQSRYGELAFGRVGALTSPFGRWGVYGLEATPFGNGWGRSGGVHHVAGMADRVDNAISYASPDFDGWKMFGQFSFQTGSNPTPGVEQSKWKHNTRRGALALRFKNEQFTAIAVVEQIWNTEGLANADFGEDTTIASAAVNFLTVPSVRLFLMGQYLKNVYNAPGTPVHSAAKLLGAGLNTATNPTGIEGRGFDGFNVGVNAQIKLWGGDLYLTTGYNDWEYKGDVVEGQETGLKHYLVGAAYEYPLSKRVHIYGSANWTHGTGLFDTENFSDSSDPNSWQAMAGLTYFF